MAKTRSRWIWLWSLLLAVTAPTREATAVDLLVASLSSGRITQVDGATGAREGIFVPAGFEGLALAAGLKIGPDGRLYVGSFGGVYRFESTGALANKSFVSGLPGGVLHLVFAPDGSLFGTVYDGSQVFHADGTTGAVLGTIGVGANPTGIAIGPDGNLYVGSYANYQVERYDPTTGASLGVFATVPTSFPSRGVGPLLFGADGRLLVGLFGGSDILRFDGTTGAWDSFIPPGDRHPANPSALAWGPDGNLYVSAKGTSEVLRYDGTTGAFLGVFAAGLEATWGLAFVPDVVPPPYPLPSPSPIVPTTSGPVQGFLDGGVFKYYGIPYAEAPTGAQRWKRPVRKAASPTTIDASVFGPRCPQLSGSSAVGNEDCLTLSLWAPPKDPNAPALPVLFYIHGGGLSGGSAAGSAEDGSNFARNQNVIVVKPQYRLGALGFFGRPGLAAEDPNGSTGNYGFLDQLEALRWVRDNIAAFGGDPNQVTISGGSAGGWSVCVLMASPLSDGLFRAGIVQSGQCINARPLTLPPTSPVRNDPFFGTTIYDRSRALAIGVGCADPDDLVCLRGKSATELVQALGAQRSPTTGEPIVNPAIDGYVLPEQPVTLLRQGAADHRPLMIGTVANESTYWSKDLVIPSPEIYELFVRTAAGNTRANALLPLYPAASYPSPAEAFRTLSDETIFACPTLDTADAIAAGGSPAWVYQLTFPPTYASPTVAGLRTFHGLDGYYVFGTYHGGADHGILADADDDMLSESMQNAWGSFVKTGVPTTTPSWPVYAPATPGDFASVSVMLFDVPNSPIPGNLFRSGRCAALGPVANVLDVDRDIATYDEDNCPVTSNTSQADAESDLVGDACDSCVNAANPRVAADFLTTNPWATLTGGQRDDDHDGYGNQCDAKFPGVTGLIVGAGDLVQFRTANGKSRTADTCGTAGNRPCAIFDLDESSTLIGAPDLARFRALNGKLSGPKCASCPLACSAGTAGSCP